MNFQFVAFQSRGEFRRAAPVEANAFERGGLGDQGVEVVGLACADVGVECAGSHTGTINVPDADAVHQDALDTLGVGEFGERFCENRAKQPPEVILPVPVILLRRQ